MPSGAANKKIVKYLLIFWALVLGTIGFSCLVMYYLATFSDLPSFEELENPKSYLATEIFSADQQLLGKYFRENRSVVSYKDISPFVINALIATEDERFQEHSGVDVKGLLRAAVFLGTKGGASTITQQLSKMLFHERARNFFKRTVQKLKEWIIAARLERQYTKEEIIMMYLNKFDFNNNAVGIKSAAAVYFNTTPDSLTIAQAAMLVGMCKNPSLYNPLRRPEISMQRRNVVLHQLRRNKHITDQTFDSLKQLPVELDFKIVDHKEGLAPYFREVLRLELTSLFNEKSEDGNYLLHKADGTPYNIYNDGLKIYTTIDSRMQKYAEYAVARHISKELQVDFFKDLKRRKTPPFDGLTKKEMEQVMQLAIERTQRYRIFTGQECANCGRRGKFIDEVTEENGQTFFVCTAEDCHFRTAAISEDSIRKIFDTLMPMRVFTWNGEKDTIMSPNDSIRYYKSFLQAGLMSMDPATGFVKAWVGGINFKHFSYDHVKQSKRQVGSTFKPFVYALAIQEGYSPCYEVPNQKVCFDLPEGGMWCPENSDAEYGGIVSLKYGLANSINTVTAWVMKQFGPNAVATFAHKAGITSPLDPVPSLCLGVADLSVYELTGANATFVNKGVWIEPVYVMRIVDKNGTVIKEFKPKTNEAMSEETAYTMLELMKGVTDGVYNRHTGKKMGTGVRIRFSSRPYGNLKYPIAGKTGTTQNNSDGWFMGNTPDLVTGVWVGAEDRSVRFRATYMGQGANMALPIWGYYMHKVWEDPRLNISNKDFEKPEKHLKAELDCEKYYKVQSKQQFGEESFD